MAHPPICRVAVCVASKGAIRKIRHLRRRLSTASIMGEADHSSPPRGWTDAACPCLRSSGPARHRTHGLPGGGGRGAVTMLPEGRLVAVCGRSPRTRHISLGPSGPASAGLGSVPPSRAYIPGRWPPAMRISRPPAFGAEQYGARSVPSGLSADSSSSGLSPPALTSLPPATS